jgi:uncharacterized membrane protein YebE (DUF533 family)
MFDLMKLARLGLIAAGAVAAWAAWLWQHDQKVAKKTEEVIVQRSEQEGAARAKKSDQAHARAKSPGAFGRLRKDAATCPDCR